MSRRHNLRPASDSLDLLLDAMCNMFGGIILISVLMVVLTRDQAMSEQGTKLAAEARDLVQRRIQRAERDLKAATDLQSEMSGREARQNAQGATDLMRQREDLTARLENARDALAKADRTRTATRKLQFADPGERQRALLTEMSNLRKARVTAENRIASLNEEIPRLEKRLAELSQRQLQVRTESTRKLRLPKERAITKKPTCIIIKYGKVYPVLRPEGSNLIRNRDSISWQVQSDGEIATPLEARGIAVLDAKREKRPEGLRELEQWMKPVSLSKDFLYISFIVYPDSFGSFNATKELVSSMGIDFGWVPYEAQRQIIFAEDGKQTPPL